MFEKSMKGKLRRARKLGLFAAPSRKNSRELAAAEGEVLRTAADARTAAVLLGCSRRTARRAATYARRLAEVAS